MVNSIGVDWSKQKLSIAVISKAIVNKIIILKRCRLEALVENGVFVGNENRPILIVVKILFWGLIIYIQTVDMRQITVRHSRFLTEKRSVIGGEIKIGASQRVIYKYFIPDGVDLHISDALIFFRPPAFIFDTV